MSLRLAADAHRGRPLDPEVDTVMAGPEAPVAGAIAAVAALIGAQPGEVYFAGGLRGSLHVALTVLRTGYPSRRHIVLSAGEQVAWRQQAETLRRQGFRLTFLGLDGAGRCDLKAMASALDDDTLLVSVAWAAPDTGILAPLGEVAALARQAGAFSHSDGTMAVGWIPVDVTATEVDFLSFSGGPLAGPQRLGALYVRRDTDLGSLAGQEARRYENSHVKEILGLGAAAARAQAGLVTDMARVAGLRDRLEQAVIRRIPGMIRLGPAAGRVPHMAAWAFEGVHAGALADLLRLNGFAIVGTPDCEGPSPLPPGIEALGLAPSYRFGAVAIGLPPETTAADVDALAEAMVEAVGHLRRRSPFARHLLR